ncbi:Rare lipoprotein A [Neorhizobium galegae bv. orientalis]|nr:Rare lipoprotein A [Neorhizobium galegae bv. orientalis]CDZ62015.1 Rare lipoprotein A [Neorhizobium galegae bv. orientalis]CDZ68749.1 Rare lipoprotein A [Neorhizobium galegae bv. orientalis]
MNPSLMTAAHRTLPFGTKVIVTNKRNGKSVVVRINDRGPFIRGRVIDVSKAAAKNIGMISSGTAQVCYQIVDASDQKVPGKGLKAIEG